MIRRVFKRAELFQALLDKGLVVNGWKCVDEKSEASLISRHDYGSYDTAVFERMSDNTFWQVTYAVSNDGEIHGLRDYRYRGGEDIEAIKVYPCYVVSYCAQEEHD